MLLPCRLARSQPLQAARRRRRRVRHAHAIGAGGHRDAQRAAERRRRGIEPVRRGHPRAGADRGFDFLDRQIARVEHELGGIRIASIERQLRSARQRLRREIGGQVEHQMRGDEGVEIRVRGSVLGHGSLPRRGRCVRRPTAGRRQDQHDNNSLHGPLRRGERIERAPPSENDVLTAIELVGDRRVADAADTRVPQRRAVARAQRERIVRRVAGDRHARRRRQHTRRAGAFTDVVAPANLARLIVDRPQHALAPHAVVRARPSVLAVLGLEEVDAVGVVRADDEQTGGRIEARRPIVRAAGLVWRDEPAVARRLFRRIGNRPAILVETLGPVHGRERRGQQTLAGRAIEHEVVAVARCLNQQLARRAVDRAVHQHRHFRRIPVVRVVRRCLKSPHQLSGVGVERDDGAGPRVVAGPRRPVQYRRGISRADVDEIELGIVRAGHPHLTAGGAAALRAWRSDRRRAVEGPLHLAGLRIERLQGAGQVVEVSGDADEQMVADDERARWSTRSPASHRRSRHSTAPCRRARRARPDAHRASSGRRSPCRPPRRDDRCESRRWPDTCSARSAAPTARRSPTGCQASRGR